ncbi:hypothetical protein B0T21DRAFT_356414 [Apiosordaria backusii]|uniref:Uncharacterized protein n=1 Tax=Apiosordaria backusii TaxID=314023 RepID=A0AA40EZE4_9PEZI|nr:hypothetical protein B0T21DRAFT_356414 [Apiosordaria backusii]
MQVYFASVPSCPRRSNTNFCAMYCTYLSYINFPFRFPPFCSSQPSPVLYTLSHVMVLFVPCPISPVANLTIMSAMFTA